MGLKEVRTASFAVISLVLYTVCLVALVCGVEIAQVTAFASGLVIFFANATALALSDWRKHQLRCRPICDCANYLCTVWFSYA